MAQTDVEAVVLGHGPDYVAFFWKRTCYRVGDFVTVANSATVFRIEHIKLFLELQDHLVWLNARPLVMLDEDERLLRGEHASVATTRLLFSLLHRVSIVLARVLKLR